MVNKLSFFYRAAVATAAVPFAACIYLVGAAIDFTIAVADKASSIVEGYK